MRWNYARPALFLGFPLPPDNRTKVPSSAPRNCGKRFSPRQVFRRNLSSGWLCDELNKKKTPRLTQPTKSGLEKRNTSFSLSLSLSFSCIRNSLFIFPLFREPNPLANSKKTSRTLNSLLLFTTAKELREISFSPRELALLTSSDVRCFVRKSFSFLFYLFLSDVAMDFVIRNMKTFGCVYMFLVSSLMGHRLLGKLKFSTQQRLAFGDKSLEGKCKMEKS
jgi:hypothetical protein